MRQVTFVAGGTIPAGAKVLLSFEQADARPGAVKILDRKSVDTALEDLALAKKAVAAAKSGFDFDAIQKAEAFLGEARGKLAMPRVYLVDTPVTFKAGESIGIELDGLAGRDLLDAMGIPRDEQDAAGAVAAAALNQRKLDAAVERAEKKLKALRATQARAQSAVDKLKNAPRPPAKEKLAAAEGALKAANAELKTVQAELDALTAGPTE